MKKDLCELVVILDESGSMQRIATDTIGGFNTFLETHQKMPGEANLTLIKFNTNYHISYNGVDVRSVKPLDNTTYTPGGFTALLDAVGRAITEVGGRYDKAEEKPKVIFLIITDGEENSSIEYNMQHIKEKTALRQDRDKWEFIFMGANQDAWATADKMGYNHAVNYVMDDINKTIRSAALYAKYSRASSDKATLDVFNMSDEEIDANLQDDIT